MADNVTSRVCEVEENACKRDVQALCYHCSKNLCRVHLLQHAQLIEEKTRTELQFLTDQFNELSSRFNQLSAADDIRNEALAQLEKSCIEAHKKIDEIMENKRQELHDEFDKYQKDFLANKEEQLVKLNTSKKTLGKLVEESDASAKQIADLQRSIDAIENYLNTLNTPTINVITRPPNWSVNIFTTYSDAQFTAVKEIREFKITYVRLNGVIRSYYVKTKENGSMADLVKSFIRLYTVIEEVNHSEANQIHTIGHLPKSDFILPVEVYDHRVQLQYSDEAKLNQILERDIIVFYETPSSLDTANNPRILMPCVFQNSQTKQHFGLPIFLSVPRVGCRGTDVRDALHNTLYNFYETNGSAEDTLYETHLLKPVKFYVKAIKLDDALEETFDFSKGSITLVVAFNEKHVDTNEWSYFQQLRFP